MSSKSTLQTLPIDSLLPAILKDFRQGYPLLITAEPGSGKTTRVPPALMEAIQDQPQNEVWVLEPRRLAAALSAQRVAQERGEPLPGRVGYHFRNEQKLTQETRLVFLTEGMMLRKMLSDPLLKNVGAILLDEFHERHADTDLALACVQALRKGPRPDLKLVILSATLDVSALLSYLGPEARVHHAPGKVFPLETKYLETPLPDDRGWERKAAFERAFLKTLRDALDAPLKESNGVRQGRDLLVFLPGYREIQDIRNLLAPESGRSEFGSIRVEVLYGDATSDEQSRALKPSRDGEPRRVILATNLAESSVTLDGVGIVIDSGLARVVSESSWSGVSALRTRPVSRASLTQRAGRAARQGPGSVYRILTRAEEASRPSYEVPELLRSDLSSVFLSIDAWRSRMMEQLQCPFEQTPNPKFLEEPSASRIQQAQRVLFDLQAIDEKTLRPTVMGRRMGEIPVSPRLARVLLEAEKLDLLPLTIRAVAYLSEGSWGRSSSVGSLDFWELLIKRVRQGSSALEFNERRMIQRLGSVWNLGRIEQIPVFVNDTQQGPLIQAFLAGFPDRVAQMKTRGTDATLCEGGVVTFSDEVFASAHSFFLVLEASQSARLGEKLKNPRVELALGMSDSELMDWGIERVRESTVWSFDSARAKVDAFDRLSYGILLLEDRRISPDRLTPEVKALAAKDLASRAFERATSRDSDLKETLSLRSFYQRWEFYNSQTKVNESESEGNQGEELTPREEILRVWSESIQSASTWSLNALISEDEMSSLMSLLAVEVKDFHRIEREVPERLDLPGRKRVLIHYPEGGAAPWIESRMQDFFGLKSTPRILGGRISLTCHLLAPSQRPVQVTQDLPSFWKNTYPQLRGELSRRYPRHSWPENPG